MELFEHGGDVINFADEVGCRVSDVIDLSSNINFVKPVININFNLIDIGSYPSYIQLNNALADLYKIDLAEFEIFNGASSAIFSLFKYLKPQHCTIYSPAYLEYKKAVEVFNVDYDLIDTFSDLKKIVKKGSLVIFVNPSTPNGQCYNLGELLNHWMQQECTVLIDESFIEFNKSDSIVEQIQNYDKLYILKSMTKFYGSAGIRIGLLISNKNNILQISQQEPAWKLSEFDSQYIQAAVADQNFVKRSRVLNKESKVFLIEILNQSKFVKQVYSSNANFVLVELQNLTAVEFQALLKTHKIMVRDCSNFDYLSNRHVRIAVKSIANLQVLKEALGNA